MYSVYVHIYIYTYVHVYIYIYISGPKVHLEPFRMPNLASLGSRASNAMATAQCLTHSGRQNHGDHGNNSKNAH